MAELLDWFTGGAGGSPLRALADVADVLVVAWLLYRILLLVRGTRAMQIAIGLGLVLIVDQLARRMMLVTLATILDGLLGTIVVLAVVLFQNDIRRVLARVGARPFFRAAERQRDVHAVEEVVKAAGALAQKHIGALIVFERDASLEEFCQQGTVIDADVSKELLYSMFVPSHENPLHDGAVIVRDGRVWQAGVFLPLTGSLKLDRALGTRHRAAIGITEETDAVVVVVSEERGTVALCFNGNIARDLDAHALRQTLLGLFTGTPKKPARGEGAASVRRSVAPPAPRGSSIPPLVSLEVGKVAAAPAGVSPAGVSTAAVSTASSTAAEGDARPASPGKEE